MGGSGGLSPGPGLKVWNQGHWYQRAGDSGCPSSSREHLPFLLLVLLRPSVRWVRPTRTGEGRSSLLVY